MQKVTKNEFYNKMGPQNVHPRPDESTFKGRFFTSHWELKNRQVVGKSVSDSWGIKPTDYYLTK